MITTKELLRLYLDADRFALGRMGKKFPLPIIDDIWMFEIILRKYEFYHIISKRKYNPIKHFYWYRFKKLSRKLGYTIPINCFGPGLRINHRGLLIVNSKAKVGKWCDVHQGVNIGSNDYCEDGTFYSCVPSIGNYVYIGPGAKIYGKTEIGDEVRIGANAVVNKSVPNKKTIYGNPFTIVDSHKNIATIASQDFEKEFLHYFPQYFGKI